MDPINYVVIAECDRYLLWMQTITRQKSNAVAMTIDMTEMIDGWVQKAS